MIVSRVPIYTDSRWLTNTFVLSCTMLFADNIYFLITVFQNEMAAKMADMERKQVSF